MEEFNYEAAAADFEYQQSFEYQQELAAYHQTKAVEADAQRDYDEEAFWREFHATGDFPF